MMVTLGHLFQSLLTKLGIVATEDLLELENPVDLVESGNTRGYRDMLSPLAALEHLEGWCTDDGNVESLRQHSLPCLLEGLLPFPRSGVLLEHRGEPLEVALHLANILVLGSVASVLLHRKGNDDSLPGTHKGYLPGLSLFLRGRFLRRRCRFQLSDTLLDGGYGPPCAAPLVFLIHQFFSSLDILHQLGIDRS